MSLSIRIPHIGGPEVLEAIDMQLPDPGPGEVRLKHRAIGVNFIDTYHRRGVYPVSLPSGLGTEAAGVVETIGSQVNGLKPGDRVAYVGGPLGAYSEVRNLAADRLVKLPDTVSDEAAAATMLKGMTAYYLLFLTFAVKPGHQLLVHAAAGGVGSILAPWAKALGATVIGSVGNKGKIERAKQLGCDHVLLANQPDFAKTVRELTKGVGVDVVYDGVGKDTLTLSLDSLKRRGLLVSFGNASGKPPAIEPGLLSEKGSLFLTRPTLAHYTATREELEAAAAALFDVIGRGIVKAEIGERFPLRDAAKAHAALESRHTMGSLLLVP